MLDLIVLARNLLAVVATMMFLRLLAYFKYHEGVGVLTIVLQE